MIRLDVSASVVLAWCTSCPSWRELRDSVPAAQAAAAAHEANCHQGHYHRRRAVYMAAARRADEPGAVRLE